MNELGRIAKELDDAGVSKEVWIGTDSTADRVSWLIIRNKLNQQNSRSRLKTVQALTDAINFERKYWSEYGGTREPCAKFALIAVENIAKTLGRGDVEYARPLDCSMCGASNSFVISPLDPAVGYCFKEGQAWRINSLTCATVGCLRPKAAFGDHCMACLEDRVNAEN